MEEERNDFVNRNSGLAAQWTKAGGLDAAKVPKSVVLPSGQRILVANQKDTGEVEAGDIMVRWGGAGSSRGLSRHEHRRCEGRWDGWTAGSSRMYDSREMSERVKPCSRSAAAVPGRAESLSLSLIPWGQ